MNKDINLLTEQFPDFIINEKARDKALNNPKIANVRIREGLFYTEDEWEEKRENSLSTPLEEPIKTNKTKKLGALKRKS